MMKALRWFWLLLAAAALVTFAVMYRYQHLGCTEREGRGGVRVVCSSYDRWTGEVVQKGGR